jgi:hypothetical protein
LSPPPPSSARPESATAAERDLRATLHREPRICVLTGGQTGVDTQAALAAVAAGLPVHLVFPHGFRQEDGPLTTARRCELAGSTLHELSCDDFAYRTWTCAFLADAVILIDPAGGDGCQETIRAAASVGRPLLNLWHPRPGTAAVGGVSSREVAPAVRSFILRNEPRVLMIAGCRASLLASAGKTIAVRALLPGVITGVLSAEARELGD